jgi:hypothetical protein
MPAARRGTFLIVAAPVDPVRDRLVQQVKSRTGRDLVVSGPRPSFSFRALPRGVTFSAPPDMGGAPAGGADIKAEVGLLSLLTGQGSVRRVV